MFSYHLLYEPFILYLISKYQYSQITNVVTVNQCGKSWSCVRHFVRLFQWRELILFNKFWGKMMASLTTKVKKHCTTEFWGLLFERSVCFCVFSSHLQTAGRRLCLLCMAYPTAHSWNVTSSWDGYGKWESRAHRRVHSKCRKERTCLNLKLYVSYWKIRGREATEENVTMGKRQIYGKLPSKYLKYSQM